MATIKSYTDINQSKKLVEILPIESADMNWHELPSIGLFVRAFPYKHDNGATEGIFPCWSLAALLKMLRDYQLFSNGLIVYIDNESYKIDSDNPVDACYEMIVKLHEQKLL